MLASLFDATMFELGALSSSLVSELAHLAVDAGVIG